MTHILAIDTTGDTGSIALLAEQTVVEEAVLSSSDGFAHVLFPEIQALLGRHGLRLADLTGFATASGPGSFTGVRVGLTAAKGLAEAAGKQAVAVSNLQALATVGTAPLRAVVIDARRGEVYGAVYDASLQAVLPEVVMPLKTWLASLAGLSQELEIIHQRVVLPEGLPYRVLAGPPTLAAAIGRIAAARFAQGLAEDPSALDANYVRRSDAELFWSDPSAG